MRYSRITHTCFDDIPQHELQGIPLERLHDVASEFDPQPFDLQGLLKCLSGRGGRSNAQMLRRLNFAWETVIDT